MPDSAYPDGKLADEAIRRLQQAAQSPDTPFFLAVGFVKPHLPFCAPKKYWDLYDPAKFTLPELKVPPEGAPPFAPTNWGELRQYSDMPETGGLTEEVERTLIHGYHAAVSYMDAQLGRVIDALEATGLDKNTIIVLWGDHGWHLGDHGMWCKHTNYEQATRIPLIVVAPGVTTGGSASAALAESVDIYPTLCELAGLPVPDNLDGTSFARRAEEPSERNQGSHLSCLSARKPNRPRRADGPLPAGGMEAARRTTDRAVLELYDYESDPGETKNLAEEQPEVVAELRKVLAAEPEAKPQITSAPARRARTPAQGARP